MFCISKLKIDLGHLQSNSVILISHRFLERMLPGIDVPECVHAVVGVVDPARRMCPTLEGFVQVLGHLDCSLPEHLHYLWLSG